MPQKERKNSFKAVADDFKDLTKVFDLLLQDVLLAKLELFRFCYNFVKLISNLVSEKKLEPKSVQLALTGRIRW